MTLTDFAIRVPKLYFTCLVISIIIGAKCTVIRQVIVGILVQNCCNQGGKRGNLLQKREHLNDINPDCNHKQLLFQHNQFW